MEATPPKNLKSKLTHLDHSLKDIERKQYPGIQRAPGSLPVLEAFQEFLDKERVKAEKRLRMVSTIFMLLMLALIAGGGILIYLQTSRSAASYEKLSRQTQQLQAATNRTAAVISGLAKQLESGRAEKEKLKELYDATAAKVSSGAATVKQLRASLNDIAAENRELRAELEKIERQRELTAGKVQELAALQAALTEKIKEIRAPSAAPGQQSVAKVMRPAAKPPVKPAENPAVIAMLIKPAGSSAGIRWRLPKLPPLSQE